MKTTKKTSNGSRSSWSIQSLIIKSLLASTLILTSIQLPLQAQETLYTRPSWMFGLAAGPNYNFYRGSTQQLTVDFSTPAVFNYPPGTSFPFGSGMGLFVAPFVEYHRPDSRFGFSLQAGYDGRSGAYRQIITPCNCPADLLLKLNYLTLEPLLRFNPFKSDFYLFAGPRLAFNLKKEFTYKQGINPDYPDQVANPDLNGELSSVRNYLVSMQIGAGLDLSLSKNHKRTQVIISPFIAYHPYFGQDPRSIETLNITTIRLGLALKVGRGHRIPPKAVAETYVAPIVAAVVPVVAFSVYSPANIPTERRVRETFPLRNHVYFNLGSTEIPDRYVLLKKDQVKEFKEDQLEVFTPKRLSGRSDREMIVYYNILNILGDRMNKHPLTSIRLTGSSEKGPADGRVMAESVKKYLVDVFEIGPDRITVEGRYKPENPSEQPGGTRELELLRESDRRVTIQSLSPELMIEFQSGPDMPLKPVEVLALQEAPIDSYVRFNAEGADEAFSSWSLDVKDKNGVVKHHGPYTGENISIPGKTLMGNDPEGDYTITMIGQTKTGQTVKKEKKVHLRLWKPSTAEEGMRYNVIFDFNDAKAIQMYEKYLTEVVTPKIPVNGIVIIHGHTDVIGSEVNNQKLSLARANEVQRIIANSLEKAGRKDVTFEVYGFGENEELSPFNNVYPEERAYNRSVIIDIIPAR